MLKNWNDPVGSKIKSNVKKCTYEFRNEKVRVENMIRNIETTLKKEVKVTFNKNKIQSLSYHL